MAERESQTKMAERESQIKMAERERQIKMAERERQHMQADKIKAGSVENLSRKGPGCESREGESRHGIGIRRMGSGCNGL